MSKKQYIGIIILVVMILGFLFYWYEFRPTQIKKECYYRSQSGSRLLGITPDERYKNCLREKGF